MRELVSSIISRFVTTEEEKILTKTAEIEDELERLEEKREEFIQNYYLFVTGNADKSVTRESLAQQVSELAEGYSDIRDDCTQMMSFSTNEDITSSLETIQVTAASIQTEFTNIEEILTSDCDLPKSLVTEEINSVIDDIELGQELNADIGES